MDDIPVPGSFHERQKELCLLSSYIEDGEQWLSGLLERLGWSKESLSECPPLVQCPVNSRHFVPHDSLERHERQCRYAALGVKMEEVEEALDGKAFYENLSIPCVEISSAVEKAIAKYARGKDGVQQSSAPHTGVGGSAKRDYIDQSEVIVESHESLVAREHFASLQDSQPTPPEILTQHPTQIIRFVKSWSLVPQDFASVDMATTDTTGLKAWLFNHLPEQHAHSSVLGGEMRAVDLVLHWLGQSTAMGGATPDALMGQLRALLGLKTRQFVLDLWKFLHTSRLQREHGLPASVVEELTPLPVATGRGGGEPGLVAEIQALAKQEADDGPSHLPLPMCHASYRLSPEVRRITYDYVAAAGGGGRTGGGGAEDPDLYRDDERMLKAKLKTQEGPGGEGKSQLEILKEQRDYKRRRQTYRAKNVHITRRTPAQVLGAIISGRMEEIRAAVLQQQRQLSGEQQPEEQGDRQQSPELDSRGDQREGKSREEESPERLVDSSPSTRQDKRSGGSSPKRRRDRQSKERSSNHGYRSLRGRSRSRSRSIERSSKHEKRRHSTSVSSKQRDGKTRDDSRERRKHKKSHKHSRSKSRDRHKKKSSRSRSRSRDRHRRRSRGSPRSQSKPRSRSSSREEHKHKT